MDSFAGKLAVITGGGSGMGRGAGYLIRKVSSPSGGSARTSTWSTTA
jgi:NADP-dependent 3-hydroxy acid dehydrogenase YdfG